MPAPIPTLMVPPAGTGGTVLSLGGKPIAGPDARGRYTVTNAEDVQVLLRAGWTIEPSFGGSTPLGGGATPTLGAIGGSGPTVAAQNFWLMMHDAAGNAFWVPVWK
jgi:hypothetical protein